MDAKFLTEDGWKTTAAKFKIKDNGLQKALAGYENAEESRHEDRLKFLASISQLSASLKKAKEVALQGDAVKYLAGVAAAAEVQKAEVNRLKALAAKASAATQKKAEADSKAKSEAEEEEEQEEEADYHTRLLTALQKLKSAKGAAYQFIVCDAKPSGLMIAKKITPKHKQQLTTLTNSRRFLPLGTCHFEDGKYVFSMEKPVMGLARKLQESIKQHTGKKLPIRAGAETAEADDEQPPGAAAPGPAAAAAGKPERPELAKAPEAWHRMRDDVDAGIKQLKAAIVKEFAGEAPEIVAEIEQNVKKLDAILDKLDRRLADSLAKAHAAKDPAARTAELNNSKHILADYISYVKSEPLIAAIDTNPFGVKVNLKQTVIGSLTEMAKAIG